MTQPTPALDACPPRRLLSPIEAVRARLSADWIQWVTENRLPGCTPESMVDMMSAAGVERSLARAARPTTTTSPPTMRH